MGEKNIKFVANFKNGSWDEGALTEDSNIVMSECAGVLQYAQTVFEGMRSIIKNTWRI